MLTYNDLKTRGWEVASATADADALISGACRVMAVMCVGTGTARVVNNTAATDTDSPNITFQGAPSGESSYYVLGNGVRYDTAVSVDVTNVNPVTVFYISE